MRVASTLFRRNLAVMVAIAGLVLAWLAADPSPLVVTVAAVCLRFGNKVGLAVVVAMGLLACGILFLQTPVTVDDPVRLASFLTAALGIWFLIWIFRVAAFQQRVQESTREIIEKLPGLGWSADAEGRIRYRNPESLEYEGKTFEQMKEEQEADDFAWAQTIHPDDVERSLAEFKHSIRTGEPLYVESRARRHDGVYHWFRDVAFPTRDETGRITGWYGTSMDIDDQKKAEEALRQSEHELRLLVDAVPVHIWLLNPEGEPSYYSRRYVEWLGMDVDGTDTAGASRLTSTVGAYVHPDDADEVGQHLRESISAGVPFVTRHRLRRHDGVYRWVQSQAEPLRDGNGKILRWYGVNIDIDDEVRAQDELRVVTDASGLGWAAYADGRLRYITPAVLAFLGVSADDLRQMMETDPNPLEKWTHPEDLPNNRANWARARATGETLVDESRARRYDGEYRWLRDTIVPSRDKAGRPTGWYGHTQDITDQKRAEEALRQSERELRLLVDTVPTMIFLATPEGLPYYFNKRFADWVGTDPRGEAVPQVDGKSPYLELIHPDDRESIAMIVDRAFASGQPSQYKGRLRRHDGEYRWLDSRVEPLRDEMGAIVRWYGVIVDIDDEVRAQEGLRLADERLARASRAASLSELSVSIAHELNSPLQAVVSNANAFQRWLAAVPPNYERARRTAERIIRDANAAAEVIKRIRHLFANGEHERIHVDINALIADVCDLMGDRFVSSGTRLELALDHDLPEITADRVQLEQVILNLVRNAIEAMQTTPPTSRVLRIVSCRLGGDRLEVGVEDTGPGIAEPERIFEAFYTTKEDGLGMGLAICRSIIEAHGGRIEARPNAGRGSLVGFTLPLRASNTAEIMSLKGDATVGN